MFVVKRVSGNLRIERECLLGWQTSNEVRCTRFYEEHPTCGGIVELPLEHVKPDTVWSDTDSQKIRKELPGGAGIDKTDTIVYISAKKRYCGEKTVAYAFACYRDQNGRPIAIGVNICPTLLDYWGSLSSPPLVTIQ